MLTLFQNEIQFIITSTTKNITLRLAIHLTCLEIRLKIYFLIWLEFKQTFQTVYNNNLV